MLIILMTQFVPLYIRGTVVDKGSDKGEKPILSNSQAESIENCKENFL